MPVRLDRKVKEQTIIIIFKGYEKRKEELERMKAPYELLVAHNYINKAIDETLDIQYQQMRLFVPQFKSVMLRDIAECISYGKSDLKSYMSNGTYKKYKKRIKEEVAKRLYL